MMLFDQRKRLALPFFIGLIMFAGTAGVVNSPFTYYDTKRWLLLFFISALLVVDFFSDRKNKRTIQTQLVSFLLVLFVSLLLLRSIISGSLAGLLDAFFWLTMSLAFPVLSRMLKSRRDSIYLINALVYSLAVYYVFLLMQYLFVLLNPIRWDIQVLATGFDNIRFLNQIQVMIFPLALLLSVSKVLKVSKVGQFVLVLTIAILFYARARGAILAVCVEVALIFGFFKYFGLSDIGKYRISLIKSVFYGGLLYVVFFVFIPIILFDQDIQALNLSSSGRLQMWGQALKLWVQRPFFGYGGMAFANADLNIYPTFGHPHSSIIQLLFEYGLLGFFLAFFLLLAVIRLVYFDLVRTKSRSDILLLCGFLGGLCLSLVSGVVVMPYSQLILMLILSALLKGGLKSSGIDLTDGHKREFSFSSGLYWFFVVICLMCLWLLSILTFDYVINEGILIFDVGPRFWFIGRMP
jgi:O-antigen ligase